MSDIRQRKTLSKVMENNGMSVSAAMKASGYSDGYSKNPHLLKNSKSFQALLDEEFPKGYFLKLHKKLSRVLTPARFEFPGTMQKKELMRFARRFANKPDITINKESRGVKSVWVVNLGVPDATALARAVDMGHKLRGNYEPTHVVVEDEIKEKSEKDLDEEIAKLEALRSRGTKGKRSSRPIAPVKKGKSKKNKARTS
jgi:hypothetical protein